MRKLVVLLPIALALAAVVAVGGGASAGGAQPTTHRVTVPDADRFTPFGLTIRAGDNVRWLNTDEDDHTVVSDDSFNTAGNKGTNRLLRTGRDVTLHFDHPGTFVYYCRFHSRLDRAKQPIAPGPDGGVENNGNFGTPMSGVITVLPRQ
jgi:plastocyanin